MFEKPKLLKHAVVDQRYPKMGPIKAKIPQWYKDIPAHQFGDKTPRFLPTRNLTLKHCVPFLDSLTTGYEIPLMVDVLVTQFDDGPQLSWGETPQPPLAVRGEQSAPNFPIYDGFSTKHHFIWQHMTVLKLPKGYSALMTHPLNRYDLPFLTLSAVVDADWAVGGGNIPFFISNTFEGLIPQGTPIMQVIPFKKESWISEEDPTLIDENMKSKFDSMSALSGWYKRTHWNKKNYD